MQSLRHTLRFFFLISLKSHVPFLRYSFFYFLSYSNNFEKCIGTLVGGCFSMYLLNRKSFYHESWPTNNKIIGNILRKCFD